MTDSFPVGQKETTTKELNKMAGGGRTAGKYGYSDNNYYSSMYTYECVCVSTE